jgi:peptidoglycan/xylan/chitin deacetylase (PgdA/CDA1 family)
VTFDDGYPDTRHVAQPIIECHEIPATVFVISGMLDGACRGRYG